MRFRHGTGTGTVNTHPLHAAAQVHPRFEAARDCSTSERHAPPRRSAPSFEALPCRAPSAPRAALASAVLAIALAGCDTIASDFSSFSESFTPPSPAQAAQWAADPNDRENARRGTILLANAPWGGATAYLRMYRLYAEESQDPLVRAAALQALGRHGDPEDAKLVAKSLESPFRQVRLASAKALQRLHDPDVADAIWPRLVDLNEDSDVRVELATALGQYPTPAVFQALVAALSQRELAVNVASVDSLRVLTGEAFGFDDDAWLTFYASRTDPFANARVYLYPTFVRELDVWDHMLFWAPVEFERPDAPIGMKVLGTRRTNDASREGAELSSDPEQDEARSSAPRNGPATAGSSPSGGA